MTTTDTQILGTTQKSPIVSQSDADASNHLYDQLTLMLDFATHRGIQIPTSINLIKAKDPKELLANYNIMTTAIAPATIQSIKYINTQILMDKKPKNWLAIPIFNKCLIIALLALIALIGISLLPSVNEVNLAKGLLSSNGRVLFFNLTFICSASLLGVMFYLLKTISDKIKNYSLLPIDSVEVSATILIGVISGFVISELFSFQTDALGPSIQMQKMTLALLGGFSSDAIFTVLQGIVNKMKMIFSPS